MATITGTRSPLFFKKVAGGLPVVIETSKFSGNIFYVDSNAAGASDTAGFGGSPDEPFATIDFAIGQCTANQGDVILVLPGHSETLTSAITLDVAGVSIIGLGRGATRPQLTINANIDGITITAADCAVKGLYWNEATNTRTASINIAAARALIEDCHFDLGANDLLTVTITADGEFATLRGLTTDITADGPDSLVKTEGVVDGLVVEDCLVIGSDGTNAFDIGVIDYNSQAVTNPVVRRNAFLGQGTALTVVANGGSVVGELTGPNTYAGSATSADNVAEQQEIVDALYGSAGISTFPTAAVPANGVSLAEALRAAFNLLEVGEDTGEADIDIDTADYTNFQNLITITPDAGTPLKDVEINFDLAKATTGFVAGHTTETIQFAVARKIDGTNWRRDIDSETTARAANLSGLQGQSIVIGDIGPDEEARVEVKLSAENAVDVEMPYALYYSSNGITAPTITPVAAA